jgi:hypothetical protein
MDARKVLVVVMSLLLVPPAAWAQGASTSSIVGVVRDTSGGVLPGVTVEATSPALIGGARTAITDGEGRYRIVDLRPAEYVVTFSLLGFSTIRREDVALVVGFTATVNAEMSVGALEQTVTVLGEAPLVDTRSTVQQSTLGDETLNELPIVRRMGGYANVIPAARGNGADVGGLGGEQGATFAVHGGRANEINVNQDGLNLTMLNSATYSFNQFSTQEVAVETSGTSAETFSGGVRVAIVPKEGGNIFAGNFGVSFATPEMQSSNLSDELTARGLTSTPSLKQNYLFGGGLGGPLKRDKLWFFTAHRYWEASRYLPGVFYNARHGTLFYEPDQNRPAYETNFYRDHSVRLTWQASQEDRLAFQLNWQENCNCDRRDAAFAPEANADHVYDPSHSWVASYTRPLGSRLLIEAGSSLNWTTITSRRPEGTTIDSISVLDQDLGFTYGARSSNNIGNIGNPCCYSRQFIGHQYNQRFALSYNTGTHAFKAGGTHQFFTFRNGNENAIDQIHGARRYRFRSGVPNLVTIYATPFGRASNSTTVSLFAQDQWTINNTTLNLGLRYDAFNAVAVAQHFAAGYFVGEKNLPEERDVPNWKNLNPRLGLVHDVFGDGRSAVKTSFGRYVLGTSSTGNNNVAISMPILNQTLQADRTWEDVNKNYVPDCVLGPEVLAANGECGALSDTNFGIIRDVARGQAGNQRYEEGVLGGFQDAQEYMWQGSVSLEQELGPNVGLRVGYFRSWYGNFQVTDNLRVAPTDFDEYCITAPVNPMLPGGGGNQICGLYDIKPEKFGQVENLVTHDRHYGERTSVFNGVDATIRARFGSGGLLQGGVSIGRTVDDNCVVVDSPQALFNCKVTPTWGSSHQSKWMVVYPLPWQLRASAIVQDLPGNPLVANYTVRNAEVSRTLGRNMGSCRGAAVCNATATINLIAPQTLFEPRRRQLDFRFARIFAVKGRSIELDLDVFNVLNESDVLAMNNTYGGSWRNAEEILPGRLVKLGVQIQF